MKRVDLTCRLQAIPSNFLISSRAFPASTSTQSSINGTKRSVTSQSVSTKETNGQASEQPESICQTSSERGMCFSSTNYWESHILWIVQVCRSLFELTMASQVCSEKQSTSTCLRLWTARLLIQVKMISCRTCAWLTRRLMIKRRKLLGFRSKSDRHMSSNKKWIDTT